ncbi:MAG: AAA family ATPase, partial [Clostridia bacterium]|nr:AAA family ATPase [Clostridia bacterium]
MSICHAASGEAVGIAVIGLNGAGKSTLAHQLAKKLGLQEIDAEDYFFPAQKASRMADLDGTAAEKSALPDGGIPFSSGRSGDEAWRAIADDVTIHPRFVISSVTIKSAEVISRLTAAVMLRAPLDTRLSRIASREERRFRERVLPGGDMYESQSEFQRFVSGRS